MNMTQNDITRPRHRITSLFFDPKQKIEFSDEISDNKSDNNAYDNESEIRIHTKYKKK